MYAKIKQLADEAIALQNKNRMDEVLREISARCERAMQAEGNNFELAPLADIGASPFVRAEKSVTAIAEMPLGAMKITSIGGVPVDAPADVLAAAQPGDTVQITGIENTETGKSKLLDVKVTPAAKSAKKGGAK